MKKSRTAIDAQCPFCCFAESDMLFRKELAVAIRDRYPVSQLHTLIVPKRHASEYFQLTLREQAECNELLLCARDEILRTDPTVTGFNIGVNVGKAAGQTIFHCHIHLIPRRIGDVVDPQGGIRNLFPGRGIWEPG